MAPGSFVATALSLTSLLFPSESARAQSTQESESALLVIARARDLSIRSLSYDAERKPYLGHFFMAAVKEWEGLPKNSSLRDLEKSNLQSELSSLIRDGLSASKTAQGYTGAPGVDLRIGVSLPFGGLGTSTTLPIPDQGRRDAIARAHATNNPLLKPVPDTVKAARDFRVLIENDPEAFDTLVPLVESLLTASPIAIDPNQVINKDERVRLETMFEGRAKELGDLREKIEELSKQNASDARAAKNLSDAKKQYTELSSALVGELREQYAAILSEVVKAAAVSANNNNRVSAEDHDALQAERFRELYNQIEGFTQGVSSIAGLISPKAGTIMVAAGEVVLSAITLEFSPSVGNLGKLLTSYASVMSYLLGGHVDIEAQRHEQIMRGLNSIEQKVDLLNRDLNRGLISLHEHIAGVSKQVQIVTDLVSDIAQGQRDLAVTSGAATARIEDKLGRIEEKVDSAAYNRWIESREDYNQGFMQAVYDGTQLEATYASASEAERARAAMELLAVYVRHADQGSSATVHVSNWREAPLFIDDKGLKPASGAAFHQLSEILRQRGAPNSYAALSRALNVDFPGTIRNPQEFLMGAVSAIAVPQAWPDGVERASAEQKQRLRIAAQEILDFQEALVSPERMKALGEFYAGCSKEVVGAMREDLRSEEMRVRLGLKSSLDLTQGIEQFLTPYQDSSIYTPAPQEVPVELGSLHTSGPKLVYEAKQVYWENQGGLMPDTVRSDGVPIEESWARLLGIDGNSTIKLDPRLLAVNLSAAAALKLRGTGGSYNGLNIGAASVSVTVHPEFSVTNQFKKEPLRNVLTGTVRLTYQYTLRTSQSGTPLVTVTVRSPQTCKVFDKTYLREFRVNPATGKALTPEELATITFNPNLARDVKADMAVAVETMNAGVPQMVKILEEHKRTSGVDTLGKGTAQYFSRFSPFNRTKYTGELVITSGSVPGVPAPLQGTSLGSCPAIKNALGNAKANTRITISTSAGNAEEQSFESAVKVFLAEQQQRGLKAIFVDSTKNSTRTGKALAKLDDSLSLLREISFEGLPAVLLEDRQLRTSLFESAGLADSLVILSQLGSTIEAKQTPGAFLAALNTSQQARVKSYCDALDNNKKAAEAGHLHAQPGSLKIRLLMKNL